RRRDGALQRGADRQGAANDRGGRAAARNGGGGSRAAGDPTEGAQRGVSLADGGTNLGGGANLPLDGLSVLDLTRLLPGGYCSLLLADFGADVVKVEDTGMGDYIRWSPPYYEGADPSARGALFLALNRGKRSIRLDL